MARILLIDDEAVLRRTLQAVLQRAGYEVTAAPNGAEGLRLWRREPLELVITDIHMPEKNGIETILELRAWSPEVPIIAISGGDRNPRVDVLGDASQMGAIRTLTKPFTIAELLAAVRETLPHAA
jgi:DNA-binding response OmpR family regulator